MFNLEFEPKSSGVECRIQEFGSRGLGSFACLSDRADVEAAIAGFLDDLRLRVVSAGYAMVPLGETQ
jgi:hypothetical protein